MHIDIYYITNTRIWATFNFFASISAIKSKYQVLNIFNRQVNTDLIHPPPYIPLLLIGIFGKTQDKIQDKTFYYTDDSATMSKFSSENVWPKYFAFLFSCELGTGEQTSESHLF